MLLFLQRKKMYGINLGNFKNQRTELILFSKSWDVGKSNFELFSPRGKTKICKSEYWIKLIFSVTDWFPRRYKATALITQCGVFGVFLKENLFHSNWMLPLLWFECYYIMAFGCKANIWRNLKVVASLLGLVWFTALLFGHRVSPPPQAPLQFS